MKLLLVGATGLVGGEVLRQALADKRIAKVVAPTRRPMSGHGKLENPIDDFDLLPEEAPWWKCDAVVCTLGTTIKKAGSQTAFRKVDFEYPLKVARLALSRGAHAYALNSSSGASAASRLFYLRTKGEVEAAITSLNYPSLTIVRPSLIVGERSEVRLGERIGNMAMALLAPLVPKRYRAVPADRIAKALLESVLRAESGVQIMELDRI